MRGHSPCKIKLAGFLVLLVWTACPVWAIDLTFPDAEYKEVEIINLHKGELAFRCSDGKMLIKPVSELTTLTLPWQDGFNKAEQKLAQKGYIGALEGFGKVLKDAKDTDPAWFVPLVEARIARAKKLQTAATPNATPDKKEVPCDLCRGSKQAKCERCKLGRIPCPDCAGTWFKKCRACEGVGKVVIRTYFSMGKRQYIYEDCRNCQSAKLYRGKLKHGLTFFCATCGNTKNPGTKRCTPCRGTKKVTCPKCDGVGKYVPGKEYPKGKPGQEAKNDGDPVAAALLKKTTPPIHPHLLDEWSKMTDLQREDAEKKYKTAYGEHIQQRDPCTGKEITWALSVEEVTKAAEERNGFLLFATTSNIQRVEAFFGAGHRDTLLALKKDDPIILAGTVTGYRYELIPDTKTWRIRFIVTALSVKPNPFATPPAAGTPKAGKK